MSNAILKGGDSGTGSMTIQAPNTNGSPVVTLPDASGVVQISGNMPAFSASMSASQTISSSTFTKVNFDTKSWDTNTNYSTSTYRFTPTVAGYYQVNCSIDAGGSTAATRALANIYKNGTFYRYGTNLGTVAGSTFSSICSSSVYLNGTTDYIECYAYIIATTAVISPSGSTWFDACLIRAA